jgi:hypothetical protein
MKLRYALASLAVLIPCFWQSRIQAGDLSSHLYNAWLARRVDAGDPLGLTLVPQTTNVLFDLLLKALLGAVGVDLAQRIAVAAGVLIFVWGAFFFAGKIAGAGRQPWALLPVIAMLAYGWVFRMGLFNFYLAMGLCFWAMALAWDGKPRGTLLAIPLLALAYTAHGLPVAWAVAVWIYLRVAAWRWAPLAAMAAIVAARGALQWTTAVRWLPEQIAASLGVNQFRVYGSRYMIPAWLTGVLWAWLIAVWARRKRQETLRDPAAQICAVTAFGILVLPNVITMAQYGHVFAYMGERMSLALAVCLCGLAARAAEWRYTRYAAGALALVFFAFLWKDEGTLNALEDQMESVVAQLPPGQRVINAVMAADVYTIPTVHIIDRVCVERCYSYGNYEPSSRQFRVRVAGSSPVVLATDQDVNGIQFGTYVVQPRDVPLYQVILGAGGRLGLRQPQPGQMTGIELWTGL